MTGGGLATGSRAFGAEQLCTPAVTPGAIDKEKAPVTPAIIALRDRGLLSRGDRI